MPPELSLTPLGAGAPWARDERAELANASKARLRAESGEAIWRVLASGAPLAEAAGSAGLSAALLFAEPLACSAFLALRARLGGRSGNGEDDLFETLAIEALLRRAGFPAREEGRPGAAAACPPTLFSGELCAWVDAQSEELAELAATEDSLDELGDAGLLGFALGPLRPLFIGLLLLGPKGPWGALGAGEPSCPASRRRALALAFSWLRLRLVDAVAALSAPERCGQAAEAAAAFLRGLADGWGFAARDFAQGEAQFFVQAAWAHFAPESVAAARKSELRQARKAQRQASERAQLLWGEIERREGAPLWEAFARERHEGLPSSLRAEPMVWMGAAEFLKAVPAAPFSWIDAVEEKPAARAPIEAGALLSLALLDPPARRLAPTLAECARLAAAPQLGASGAPRGAGAALPPRGLPSPSDLAFAWAKSGRADAALPADGEHAGHARPACPTEGLWDAWLLALEERSLAFDDPDPLLCAASEAWASALLLGESWARRLLSACPGLLERLAVSRRRWAFQEFFVWFPGDSGPELSECPTLRSGRGRWLLSASEAALLFGSEALARDLVGAGAPAPAGEPFVELVAWSRAGGPRAREAWLWAQRAHARFEAFDLAQASGGGRSGAAASERERGALRL
jgi:hypothetical protein